MTVLTLAPTKLLRKGFILYFIIVCISLKSLAQPAISSFSPGSGAVGTAVTITGTNFSSTPAGNIVLIGGIKANVTAATTTSLTVTIPAGAMFQPVSVTTNGLTAYSKKPFVVTFSGGASQFTPQSFIAGGKVDSVDSNIETTKYAVGDLDGDGGLDVVTIDRLNNTLSVYRNTTTGAAISFAPKTDFTTGASPRSVAIADLDGDGKPDVVVTNLNDNTVSIFRNTTSGGAISFAPKVSFLTATQPAGIAVTDLDKDGKPDLVINTINLAGYVSVLRNTGSTGTISFATKLDLQLLSGSVEEIRTADIDGDGKEDIVVPNYWSYSISILRNTSTTGSLSFAAKVDIATSGQPIEIEMADLNDDNKPDLVVTYFLTGSSVSVFRNISAPGTVTFDSAVNYLTPKTTDGLGVNDLDGDSKPDILVGVGGESVAVLKNKSTAGGNLSFNAIVKSASLYTTKIITGDFDGDGKPDISSDGGMYRVIILKNETTKPQIISITPTVAGTGATITIKGVKLTGTTAVSFGGVAATSFTVVDDNTITAVVAGGASGVVTVTAPHGSNSLDGFTYVPAPIITSFTPTTGVTGQTVTITGDNFLGVTAASFGGVPAASFVVVDATTIKAVVGAGAAGNIVVTTIGGTATIGGFNYIPPPDVISFTPATGTIGTTVTITGINFTNATDVRFGNIPAARFNVLSATTISAVVLGGATGYVKVITPGGADSLAGFTYITPPAPVITSINPTSGPVGTTVTITGNNFNTDTLNYVYFGAARATIQSVSANTLVVQVPSGANYGPVSVTSNFLTALSPKPFIPTFTGGDNITAGSFSDYTSFVTGTGPNDVCIADFDGDGKNDLASGCYTGTGVSVLRNNGVSGNISFEPIVDYGSSTLLMHLESVDMDGDGKKDIVGMGSLYRELHIYRNASTPGTINFANRSDITVADDAFSFTTGDFDGDGKPDIVTVSAKFATIIRNTSVVNNISLGNRIDLALTPTNNRVKVADLDGDGKPDIVVLNNNPGSLVVFRNTSSSGSISFASPVSFALLVEIPGSYGPNDLFIGDLDGDGKPEIATSNTIKSRSISILKNNSTPGTISFPERKDLMTGSIQPFSIVFEDLDGDGKPDLAFDHGYVPRMVCAIKNNSTPGTLSFDTTYSYVEGSNGSMGFLRTGDLNGDGMPEIISAGTNSGPGNLIYVFRNRTNGPHLTSFTPTNGIAGNVITITGSNFTGATAVSFGGVAATSFTVQSPTTITAVVGSGAAGDVKVTTPLGTDWKSGFLYGLLPTITSFTPNSGTLSDVITIIGTNFTGAKSVSFGGVNCNFIIVSDTEIKATVWVGASGNVSVTGPGGTATVPGFTYVPPPPIVNYFSPTQSTSGASVTIYGSNFTGATAVSFGGVPAKSFSVYGSGTIYATVGAGASGEVRVTTPDGTGKLAGFTYVAPTATITSFSPTSGKTGTVITINGTNLSRTTYVSFGGVPVSSFTEISPTQVTAVVGSGASGDVSVTTQNGIASMVGFTYIPPPVITSFTPNTAGTGTAVTITGSGFTGAVAVGFGAVAASSYTINSDKSITAVVGPGASGDVYVITPGGSASLTGFTYSKVTAIVDPGNVNSDELTVKPNPARDILIIKHPSAIKKARIRFVNVVGREVKAIEPAPGITETVTSVRKLPAGVYYIIFSEGTRVLSRIIVVQ